MARFVHLLREHGESLMPPTKMLGSPRVVLDRAIRKHLRKLGEELIAAAASQEAPWAIMARTARSLARLGLSGSPEPLDWDASDEETAGYYRVLRMLAEL